MKRWDLVPTFSTTWADALAIANHRALQYGQRQRVRQTHDLGMVVSVCAWWIVEDVA